MLINHGFPAISSGFTHRHTHMYKIYSHIYIFVIPLTCICVYMYTQNTHTHTHTKLCSWTTTRCQHRRRDSVKLYIHSLTTASTPAAEPSHAAIAGALTPHTFIYIYIYIAQKLEQRRSRPTPELTYTYVFTRENRYNNIVYHFLDFWLRYLWQPHTLDNLRRIFGPCLT